MPVEFLVYKDGDEYPVIAWQVAPEEQDAIWEERYQPPDYWILRCQDAGRLDMDNQWFESSRGRRPHMLLESVDLLERTRINDPSRYGEGARRRKHPFTLERLVTLRKDRFPERDPVIAPRDTRLKTYVVRGRNGGAVIIHSRR